MKDQFRFRHLFYECHYWNKAIRLLLQQSPRPRPRRHWIRVSRWLCRWRSIRWSSFGQNRSPRCNFLRLSLLACRHCHPSRLQRLWHAHRRSSHQRYLRRHHLLTGPRIPSRNRQKGETRLYHRHPATSHRMGNLHHVLRRLRLLFHRRPRLLPHSMGHPIHPSSNLNARNPLPPPLTPLASQSRPHQTSHRCPRQDPSPQRHQRPPRRSRMGRNNHSPPSRARSPPRLAQIHQKWHVATYLRWNFRTSMATTFRRECNDVLRRLRVRNGRFNRKRQSRLLRRPIRTLHRLHGRCILLHR